MADQHPEVDATLAAFTRPFRGAEAPPQELRIALAMRGGVSLAVWIGGAVAELDLLRRGVLAVEAARADQTDAEIQHQFFVGLEPGSPSWQRVMAYGRTVGPEYTSIRIDVLAGASAGGLNAVLYGLAQTLGIGVEWMRSTWMAEGDLWQLMRPGWRPGQAFRVDSLLRGDGEKGFYERVKQQASDNAAADNLRTQLVADHVSVNLAATLEASPAQFRSDGDQLHGQARSARRPEAHFHFRKVPRPAGRKSQDDMPTDPADDSRLARLAYAARTTSSFPGAFEPATIRSSARPVDDLEWPLNFRGTFSETTSADVEGEEARLRVFDGGVFDNIPITRALDAIADMPADVKVERHLFYLDPDPPDTEQPPGVGEAPVTGQLSTFFLTTALRALRMKQRVETSDDDVETIRHALGQADQAKRRRKTSFVYAGQVLKPPPDARVTWDEEVWNRYVNWRSGNDADRISGAAVRPGLATLRYIGASAATDVTLTEQGAIGLRLSLREQLEGVHQSGGEPDGTPPACASDARSLFLICGHLIAAAERTSSGSGDEADQHWARRQRLQLLRTVAACFADGADLASLTAGQRRHFDATEMARVYGVVAHTDLTPPQQVDAAFVDALEWKERPEVAGNPWAVDEAAFWDSLLSSQGHLFEWHQHRLWKLAAEHATVVHNVIQHLNLTHADVVGLKRLNAYLCAQIGEPVLQSLRDYRSVTASAEALAGSSYDKVEAEGRRLAVETLIKLPSRQLTPQRIGWQLRRPTFVAQTKLAGNQLGNFAGFLDGSWRDHDFEWGRRDAAKTIMEGPLRRVVGAAGELPWSHEPELDRSRYGLSDLSPRRRFGLASRVVQLLQRAVWPLTWTRVDGDAAWRNVSVRNALLAVLLLALRLPLSVLPLVVTKLRLLIVVVTAVLSVRQFAPTPNALGLEEAAVPVGLPHSEPGALAWVLAVALVVAIIARIVMVGFGWWRVGTYNGKTRPKPAWSTSGLALSATALLVMVPGLLLVLGGRADALGLSVFYDGWHRSTWFERSGLLALLGVGVLLLPGALSRVHDSRAEVLKTAAFVVGLPVVLLGLLWALSMQAETIDPGPGWFGLSSHGTSLAAAALVAGVVVAVTTYGWTQLRWCVSATLSAVVTVMAADSLLGELAEEGSKRYAVVLVVLGLFALLILLVQLLGARVSHFNDPAAMGAMVAGALLAALLGQLIFQSLVSLGIPFGLWQGVFLAALTTVFVQPAGDLEWKLTGKAMDLGRKVFSSTHSRPSR
jgi:predicted acylesterase/phospholipase RssA